MTKKRRDRRKFIRYFRWTVKAAFLVFFVFPVIYLLAAPDHFVYSYFFGGFSNPLFALPYGQSVCVTWTFAYGQIGPGAWLICPVGGLQTLLTSQAAASYILPTLVALLLFLLPIFIFGNFFCGWVCPVGTIIDSFDKVISKWLPRIEFQRQQRLIHEKEQRRLQSTKTNPSLNLNLLGVCPTCFIGKVLGYKHAGLANGILVTSLVGSAYLKFPVFCTFCPIGLTTRGMFHLKAWTYLTNTMMPIILELTIIPLTAVLLSLRQKRYWCRKICPVGATLNLAGSISPFFKPEIQSNSCIVKISSQRKETNSSQIQPFSSMTCRRCENVCPQGINLVDKEPLLRCTKCLECYLACPSKAVNIQSVDTPDAITWVKRIFKKKAN